MRGGRAATAAKDEPMSEPCAHRTLVKSPPELWTELSDVDALARHLGEFGEIRITRLEPETAVAWEGDRARGTVELEPSGWGTKVTITAALPDEPEPDPEPAPEPAPLVATLPATGEPGLDPGPAGLFARLFRRRRRPDAEPAPPEPVAQEPVPPPPADPAPDPDPDPDRLDAERTLAILTGVLDDLGAAHHRPFSRS
jgi:hypothetical protein